MYIKLELECMNECILLSNINSSEIKLIKQLQLNKMFFYYLN